MIGRVNRGVAQVADRLYRGRSNLRTSKASAAIETSPCLPIRNRRDSRLEICATAKGPRWLLALVFLALAGFAPPAGAQALYMRRYQEPEWLTFHLSEVSAGV
jgi:hypothetical protein